MSEAKPFIKWVGGKTQLLPEINNNLPNINNIETYIEPFIGGGAVMFDIVPKLHSVKNVIINDFNFKLTNVYKVIKTECEALISLLSQYQTKYDSLDSKGRSELFYNIRNKFNEVSKLDEPSVELAANFIFLNKTCFNGLYRENSRGKFNVPFNNAAKPCICNAENLRAVCAFLIQYDVKILTGSYEHVLKYVTDNTFVYLDPPYRPITKSSAFTSYTKSGFNDDNQKELKIWCDSVVKKHGYFMLSNSDPKNSDPDDNFFDDLYSDYKIIRVNARRNINSKGSARGQITEILVKSF